MCKKSLFRLFCFGFAAVLSLFPATTHAQAADKRAIAVMELFTSTGCPACPAADDLARQIDERYADVLVLSCHVTFFDRRIQGPKISQKFCDGRQKQYHKAKIVKQTYTPQVVINGQYSGVGSRRADVITALRNGGPLPVIGVMKRGDTLDIDLPAIAAPGSADLWLVEYTPRQSDPAVRGTVNVITSITKIMSWNGARLKTAVPISDPGKSHAVLVQNAMTQEIIAAGKAR